MITTSTPARSHASKARAWPREKGGLYRSGEVRILIVDDDDDICRLIQTALAPNDFKVEVVSEASTLLGLAPGQTGTFMGQTVDDTSLLLRLTLPGIDFPIKTSQAKMPACGQSLKHLALSYQLEMVSRNLHDVVAPSR